MNQNEIIEEYGIEFAIEKIDKLINKKLKEYKETKDTIVQKELANLLEDRDKIYNNDYKIIEQYLNKE